MKNFLKKTALLVTIISALSNVNVHALGKGGAGALGFLGGITAGHIMSSGNNRGEAEDAYYQGRRDAQREQERYAPDYRYADQASYEYDMAQKKCLRLPMQQRKQCLDRAEQNRPIGVDYIQE